MPTKIAWKTFIATPGNRRRKITLVMLGLFSQWSGNGLVSYYLAGVLDTIGITNARTQNIINGCLQIWNWTCAISSAFLTAHLKCRTQFLISVCGILAVFATQTICAGLFNERTDKAAGSTIIAMLFVFYAFYTLAFNSFLYSYTVELLPFPIRAKGFSVLMYFGKSANFINAVVNPIGLAKIGWKYYIVYVGWLSVEVVAIYCLLVETKGPSWEAIAAKIDKKTMVVSEGNGDATLVK